MFFINVDDDFLDRLQAVAGIVILIDDARTANAKLEAFTAHVLDQDRQKKFAATGDDKCVRLVGVFHLQGDVASASFFRRSRMTRD